MSGTNRQLWPSETADWEGHNSRFAGPWVVRVLPVEAVRGYEEWLTPAERARRDRLARPADRTAYVAAHLLVRTVAAELVGAGPYDLTLTHRCPDCGGVDHGRPSIEGPGDDQVHVSLSHAHGVVAAIASHQPCGIDVEQVGREIPARALTAAERTWIGEQPDLDAAATLLWTRKEALAKATGTDLAHALTLDTTTEAGVFGTWRGLGHVASWIH